MSLAEKREFVRQRAQFLCEYCNVSESDTGGELTIDHYQPRSKGGDDSLDNLIYACIRCNQYKHDYWPKDGTQSLIWNPRLELQSNHFIKLDDGKLIPITPIGEATIQELRLNREPLLLYRKQKRQKSESSRLLTRYRDLVQLLEHINQQYSELVNEQNSLLEEQHELLNLFLDSDINK